MIEGITDLPYRVVDTSGAEYYASVAAEQRPDGRWEAWLEFVPTDESEPLLTPTETTQSSRAEIVGWANALSDTYVSGAFARAVAATSATLPRVTARRTIAEAAADTAIVAVRGELPDPFALYADGVTAMRAGLSVLTRRTLLDVIAMFDLNPARKSLGWLTQAQLITFIVTAVEVQVASGKRSV